MKPTSRPTLTDHDKQHLRDEYEEILLDGGDIDGPEVVMTSLGYVELWIDGDVCAYGEVIWNVQDDD
jgi:hypothetical protein